MFKKFSFILILLSLSLILSSCDSVFINSMLKPPEPPVIYSSEASKPVKRSVGLKLNSKAICLYDVSNDELLYDLNSEEIMAPASLTKMITVYYALSKIDNPDEEVTVTFADLEGLYEANASVAGLFAGDVVTIRDLLYCIMLPSGADAANCLARYISGSVDKYVEELNTFSEELGLINSSWANVTGLDDDNHYSTAYDLTNLLIEALKNETFKEIITTDKYVTSPTKNYPSGIPLQSTLSSKIEKGKLERGYIIGGKTGFTDNAGLCLASIANIHGNEYVCVTLGAEGDSKSIQTNIIDALKIYSKLS